MKKLLIFSLVTVVSFLCSNAQSISLTSGSSYSQNFDALSNTAGSTTNSLSVTGWYMTETGGGARDNEQYAVDNGASTTGDSYSYGAAAATDRALGGLRSGTLIPLFGASFTNNTGVTITSITVSYIGEEWRLGTISRTDQLDFKYSTNATSLTTGTWTDVNNLDFVTPVTATAGAKDGNAVANRTAISYTITGLSIANGATFWISWTDLDASGADDGLAVDNFSLSTNASTLPVKFTGFEIAKEQQTLVATWATLTETNSGFFELQRSVPGSNRWSTIATVTALGYSNMYHSYKAMDPAPLSGAVLYRIRCVDQDGLYTYSDVLKIQMNTHSLRLRLYPNPASELLHIQFTTAFTGVMEITNSNGQSLIQSKINRNTSVEVSVKQLPAGQYFLRLLDTVTGTESTELFLVK